MAAVTLALQILPHVFSSESITTFLFLGFLLPTTFRKSYRSQGGAWFSNLAFYTELLSSVDSLIPGFLTLCLTSLQLAESMLLATCLAVSSCQLADSRIPGYWIAAICTCHLIWQLAKFCSFCYLGSPDTVPPFSFWLVTFIPVLEDKLADNLLPLKRDS